MGTIPSVLFMAALVLAYFLFLRALPQLSTVMAHKHKHKPGSARSDRACEIACLILVTSLVLLALLLCRSS